MKLYSLVTFVVLLLLFSCNSQDSKRVISVFTSGVTIEENRARVAGNYINTVIDIDYSGNINSSSLDISDHGHCWSSDSLPSLSDNLLSYGPINNVDTFYSEINNLEYGTTYFSRAFIIVDNTIHYGNTIKFTIGENEEEPEPEEPEEPEETKKYWTEKNNFIAQASSYAQGFVVGNYFFLGLSSENNQDENRRFFRYNTNNDTWVEAESFDGTAVNDAVLLSYNQKGYLIGGNRLGFTKSPTDQFYEYDSQDNEWDKLDDFKGRARRYATGFRWRNFIIYGLGENRDDLWAYDIDREKWDELKFDIPRDLRDRESAVSFTYGNLAFIGFGREGNYKNDLWSLEIEKGKWEKKSDFPGSGRIIKCLFVIDNNAYFVSGFDGSPLAENWKYDLNNDSWSKVEDDFEYLDKVIFGLTVNNRGYALINNTKSFWSFNPNKD